MVRAEGLVLLGEQLGEHQRRPAGVVGPAQPLGQCVPGGEGVEVAGAQGVFGAGEQVGVHAYGAVRVAGFAEPVPQSGQRAQRAGVFGAEHAGAGG
ncbi:hypothetical protein MZC64_38380 [Crossiella sp. S99.2]|nr:MULTISPECIES: hypothetical protein [unclassified Crossiella]MCK2243730.1 hypothetical protein [Crossiella sp. S99.2]MCK2257589.1 hypothetical protein [Crossiella sp. S99.1]